ncbi:MAG: NUDIX domain-containing protein [Terracidiphilus sp.]
MKKQSIQQHEIQITVDIVVFTVSEQKLKVLLIQRGIPPFKGQYALPGGFVLANETLDAAAFRELSEETGTENIYLEQLYTFGDPKRDPRGRVVTVAYYALVPTGKSPLLAGTDAASAGLFPVEALPTLAFDHGKIIEYAVNRLRNKLEYTSVGFELLPKKFTLTTLQMLHEAILGRSLDKRNFRRKILSTGLLTASKEMEITGRKPARLYAFRNTK